MLEKRQVLLVDNEDSFTFNLVQLLEDNGAAVDIVSGKETDFSSAAKYSYFLFSPGPGLPQEFPLMQKILERLEPWQKVLGICLGHQCIATFYGAKLFRQAKVRHGYRHSILNLASSDKDSVLYGLPQRFDVGLYHSWAVSENQLPPCLRVCALDYGGDFQHVIMGLRHNQQMIEGLQFHPESFLTPYGHQIIENWLR